MSGMNILVPLDDNNNLFFRRFYLPWIISSIAGRYKGLTWKGETEHKFI